MELVPILALAVGVFVVAMIGRAFRQLHASALQLFASRHGLGFVPGESVLGLFPGYPKVQGQLGSASVTVDTYASGTGKNRRTYTRLRVRDPEALCEGRIRGEGMLSSLGKLVGGEDVILGDPAFDDALQLEGDPAQLRARLGASGRAAVRRAVQYGWELTGGEWVYRAGRLERDEERLTRHLEVILEVTRTTRLEAGGLLPTLWRVAVEDPERAVRAQALRERLVRRPLPTDEALGDVIAAGGEAGVVAAAALSDGGIRQLRGLLSDRDAALPAALALAGKGQGGADIEAVLLAALADDAAADAAIGALEVVGTVRAVPALEPWAGGMLPSARKAGATRAVRAIQARASGDAGDLSLADLSGGELSEAEIAGRRTPQAE